MVRFLPNLRRQLVVMLRTMDNVAVFFALLMLFIFIFRFVAIHNLSENVSRAGFFTLLSCSILGMNLFGCKFCDKTLKGEKGEEQVCDRKNFDTLLWAIVTVFQVII